MIRVYERLGFLIFKRALKFALSREPHVVIGDPARPYMKRWFWLPRNKWLNFYIHLIQRSDDEGVLHDHPWFNLSLIIAGEYTEHTIRSGGIKRAELRKQHDFIFRTPWDAHRLEVLGGCWTLFITGPVMRRWGFHCPKGWVHWKQYVQLTANGNTTGHGCGE